MPLGPRTQDTHQRALLFHDWIAEDKFFAVLEEGDARAAAAVKAAGCRHCGGRLGDWCLLP